MSRIKLPSIAPSEITDEATYLNRRHFLKLAGLAASTPLIGSACAAESQGATGASLGELKKSQYSTDEELNSFEEITSYNNFYEFGTGKEDPAKNAKDFVTSPWEVKISGECEKPGTYSYEDIVKPHPLEERIYRLRCVERWSMVIPWVGFPLGDLLKRFQPTSKAKYVYFKTLLDRKQMPGTRRRVLDWPYEEGLRMDEAMHPLTIIAVGLYGKELPNQNGAPMRLVVPWKYGFKSIKSVVEIAFVEKEPPTSWNKSAPHEYGFFSNVNPARPHPRWSQASERRLGQGIFGERIPTEPFNGYGEYVADLYAGMDLIRRYY